MTAVAPAPTITTEPNGGGGGAGINNAATPSEINSFRITSVVDRLFIHIYTAPKNNGLEFYHLCLSLARGIDFAISTREVPSRARDLPSLLKQVCQQKNDIVVQAAIMVLMISVKSACQSGWFSERDSEELQNLAEEISRNFCTVSSFNTESSSSLSVISTIMSRFYPTMKMGQIFSFLEVQPGFCAYVRDFQIPKNVKFSREDKIRLFVVQTDSIETASCLITPPKVNFLLNGKGVERRTNLYMDPGPQTPTVVTPMLKYGSNLLQCVGDFNGNYIIAVSLMSVISIPDSNALQDCVQHALATVDSDSEIIEGPSRISINCPISFGRIKTPVKGHSCRHLQCFDFENYVDINSRRPSWRCPHCNQHACFTDIRRDQSIAKVLKEVGSNVTEVIISSDGSWSAVMEADDATQKPENKTSSVPDDESAKTNSAGLADTPVDTLDLTDMDDVMDSVSTHEMEDIKLSPQARQSLSVTQNLSAMANTNDVNTNNSQIEDSFWSGIYLSTFGTGTSNVQLNPQAAGVSMSTSNNTLSHPFSTDVITHASNRQVEAFPGHVPLATSAPEIETAIPNNLQLQQYQFGNSSITNEYGRLPSTSNHVKRTPIAIQALPAQSPTLLQRRSRNNMNTFIRSSPSAASPASPSVRLVADGFKTVHSISPQASHMPSPSSLQQYPGMQQNRSRPCQQNLGLQVPNQVPNAYRVPNERQSSSPLQMPRSINQSFGPIESSQQLSANFSGPQIYGGGSQSGAGRATGGVGSHPHLIATAQRNEQMARHVETSRPSLPYSLNADARRMPSLADQIENTGGTSLPASRTDAYDPADQNWRPTGRMRGALSGQAYSDALNQYILRPTQQAIAARPMPNATSYPGNVSAPLQPLMANRVSQGPQVPNHPSTGPAS